MYEERRDGTIRLISAGNGGFQATFVDASDSGDHVLFSTTERVLPAVDGDAVLDLYDRRADGTLRLVTPGTALALQTQATRRVISANGAQVAFFTADQLVPADVDSVTDTYLVPTAGGPYTLATPGNPAIAVQTLGFENRAGTRTWFTTTVALDPADNDAGGDVYERRADGTLRLISNVGTGAAASIVGGLDDGSSVVFSTTEKVVAGDTDTAADLYERRTDGSLRLISGGSTPDNATFAGESADGSIAFLTSESLDPVGDGDGQIDAYLRRPDGALLVLTPGTGANGLVFPAATIPSTRARTIFFSTLDIAGTGDANGLGDAYEATVDGPRPLAPGVAGGTTLAPSQMAADGSRILFTTLTALAAADTDTAQDVYEADFALPKLAGVTTLAGNARVGTTHTCKPAATATGEGVTRAVAWLRDAAVIAGATAATYKPGPADAGRALRCRAIARNGVGAATVDSAPRVIAPAALTAKLAGFPILGTKLTCTAFAGAATTGYAWKRGTRAVRGRTARTYKIGSADLGKRLTCTATGRKGTLATTVAHGLTVPRRCSVGNVRGLTPAAAQTKLQSAGCRTKLSKVTGSGVKKGLVLGTSPARGAKRDNGTRITIRVRR